jgi:hypothetical protein
MVSAARQYLTMRNNLVINITSSPVNTPGSTVTGTVDFQAAGNEDVSKVVIEFSGRCKNKANVPFDMTIEKTKEKTKATPATTTHNDANLFETRVLDLSGPCKAGSVAYSWPFTFTFPELTEQQQSQLNFSDSDTQGFFETKPHPLPPSMAALNYFRMSQLSCAIRYELKAVVNRNGALSRRVETVKVLTYQMAHPASANNMRHELFFLRPSKQGKIEYSSPNLDPGRHSRSNTLKDLFGPKSAIPSVSFSLSMTSPAILSVDQHPVPLTIKVDYDEVNSTAQQEPEFYLRFMTITFEDRMRILGANGAQNIVTQSTEHCHFAWPDGKSIGVSRSSPHAGPVRLSTSNHTDLSQIAPLILKNDRLLSFTTYVISARHRITIELGVECGGRIFGMGMTLDNLTVIPGRVAPPLYMDEESMAPAYPGEEYPVFEHPSNFRSTVESSGGGLTTASY